ncbi:MAG TPA: hypothetical protein VKQ32_18575 [Polyangia bacterium]|nr:hypothetical protein [Polyangia bacterium]
MLFGLALTLAVSLAATSVARAEPATIAPAPDRAGEADRPDRTDRPWAAGIPEEAQKQALGLFEEGNKLFENSEHAAALAKYREALKVWDHPAIRYNAAVALINLDQPLTANANLELALRFGEAPFNPETYQQALTYRKLLRGQLAQLKVSCAESGADVALDGETLFVAPGESERWLLPGSHQLVARKTGYLTETRSLSLLPGKPSVETLALQEIGSLPTRTVRRWPTWRPWAVVGGGALLALAGVPLLLDVKSNLDAYDAGVQSSCPSGCPPGMIQRAALDAHDRARTENVIAVSLFAVGGAVIASGVALVILNQPRVVPADERPPATVAPLVGRGTLGLSIAFER